MTRFAVVVCALALGVLLGCGGEERSRPAPGGIPGRYLNKADSTYIELRPDGTFSAGTPTAAVPGKYTVDGDTVRLVLDLMPNVTDVATLKGSSLVKKNGKVFTKE